MQKKRGNEQETGSVGIMILSTGIQACLKRSQYFNLSQSLASRSTFKVEGSEIKPWQSMLSALAVSAVLLAHLWLRLFFWVAASVLASSKTRGSLAQPGHTDIAPQLLELVPKASKLLLLSVFLKSFQGVQSSVGPSPEKEDARGQQAHGWAATICEFVLGLLRIECCDISAISPWSSHASKASTLVFTFAFLDQIQSSQTIHFVLCLI